MSKRPIVGPDVTLDDVRLAIPGEHVNHAEIAESANTYNGPTPSNTQLTLGAVMMRTGWRVEVFWNSGGNWFTARMVNLDGHLVPFESPIGAGGQSPEEAVANLHVALEGTIHGDMTRGAADKLGEAKG